MDSFKFIMKGILLGMKDSIFGIVTIFHLDLPEEKSKLKKREPPEELSILAKRRATEDSKAKTEKDEKPSIHYRLAQCCALNGGIVWLSILAFDNLLIPALSSLIHLIFGSSSILAGTVWSWSYLLLLCTFKAVWVLPVFLLSKIVNSLWFQDIADSAYRQSRGRPQLLNSYSILIADTLFSVLIQALFLVQGMLVTLLPIGIIGQLVSLIHMCLLYSLYAFEYKWLNMGWELHKRLSYIEKNWPYFVGFGLPLAVLTTLAPSYILSGCIFSIFFPLFIISANVAKPITGSCGYSLKLFSPVVYLSNVIFNRTMGSKSGDSQKLSPIVRQHSENAYRR